MKNPTQKFLDRWGARHYSPDAGSDEILESLQAFAKRHGTKRIQRNIRKYSEFVKGREAEGWHLCIIKAGPHFEIILGKRVKVMPLTGPN